MSAILLAAVFAATTPDVASRMSFTHGSDLIARCQSSQPQDGSFCLGFIAAVFETVRAYESWLNMREICIPRTVALADMRDAVVKRITANPDDRLGQGASVVVLAFKERWPCPATTPSTPNVRP